MVMFFALHPMESYIVYFSKLIRFTRAFSYVNTRNKLLTQNFLNKANGIINLAKPFLNFIGDTMI